MLLISSSDLNRFSQNLFPEFLRHCQGSLIFVDHFNQSAKNLCFSRFFAHPESADWQALNQSPKKANCSIWHRFWLNSFLMHWVFLLHKHRLFLHLNGDQLRLKLNEKGEVLGCEWQLSRTIVDKLAKNQDFFTAYQQLKTFLTPIFNQLSEQSQLNIAVFWHNTANLLEFCLKQLEQENIDISSSYAYLFEQKKWQGSYGQQVWNPFHHPVEYVDFPVLPFPQPVRLRKVCCMSYLAQAPNQPPTIKENYCMNCPKLKKLPQPALEALVRQWQS